MTVRRMAARLAALAMIGGGHGIRASGIVGPKTWAAYYKVDSATGSWGC